MPLAKVLLGELLLTQLPALQVVVLLGGQAQSGWDRGVPGPGPAVRLSPTAILSW